MTIVIVSRNAPDEPVARDAMAPAAGRVRESSITSLSTLGPAVLFPAVRATDLHRFSRRRPACDWGEGGGEEKHLVPRDATGSGPTQPEDPSKDARHGTSFGR